ncbi:MAG: hypothetical protein WCJ72_09685 [Chryseobacterium sp.]
MANSTENRIDTVIADANIVAIKAAFISIDTALDGSTASLTEPERTSLFSLDVANKEFATDCLAQGTLLMAKLPPALQTIVSLVQTDLTLNAQTEQIENTQLAPLALKLSDTRRLSGHEAYVGALAIYKMIEAMAGMGIEGFQAAYDVLKPRFAGQGGRPVTPP